jgi:DAK2 domain fusion protein YloV
VSELGRVRELARGALVALERNRRRIDDLNVYPVPDGDTGTNLTLTVRAVVEHLDSTQSEDREALARELTRAALMGARGNSGVIFSQILRGFAEVAGTADPLDSTAVARAFRSASDAAYRAVRKPVEGTMLTVIREMAEEAELHTGDEPIDLLRAVVSRGEAALARTQETLDILREAGVVDAGGAGLLELVRGLTAAAAGEPIPEAPEREELAVEAIHQGLSKFRYCTVFVVESEDLDADALEQRLAQLGDSLLVVGDPTALKVHVHTDDPGAALSEGLAIGTLDGIEIANMHRQTEQREERLLHAVPDALPSASEVVAVIAGAGNRALFESLGATQIVEGGQSMNPAASDLVAAIERAHADEVIVLPNNSNVLLAAEQGSKLASKRVRVVRTDSIPAGLAAMVAFDPSRTAEENAAEMEDVVAAVATGAVTVASKDARLNGMQIRKGSFLGLAEGEPVAEGADFDTVARAVVERLLAEPRGVMMLLTGADEPDVSSLVAEVEAEHPDLELEVHSGGQPHYPLLLSAE